MIWANGTQNSGLVNFASELILPLFCSNQYHLPKNDHEGLKLISKKALKKWNTNFRYLEYSVRKNRGVFHSTKTLENLETASNGTEISQKRFLKFWKLLNSEKRSVQMKFLEIPAGNKVECKLENFPEQKFENLGIRRKALL